MREITVKNRIESRVGNLLAALLLAQPFLDVLSYFMAELGATAVTTGLRMVLLAAVSFLGFWLSDRKQRYAALYAALAGFWLLHVLNCFRIGYADPVGDAAEYLKLIQFPLWTAAFLTMFRSREHLELHMLHVFAVNLFVILLVIGLSYLTGHPVYTYDFPERGIRIGILGWFGVANAQSALLSLLAPLVMLWGLRTQKIWIFTLCCTAGMGLLYVTGTRLTYYTAILAAAVFVVVIALTGVQWKYCIPLLCGILLLLIFRGAAPMSRRAATAENTYTVYQEKIDAIMGEDKDFVFREGEDFPQGVREKIKTVYVDVYTGRGVFNEVMLGDLIDSFGLEKVMEKFRYSTDSRVLGDGRLRKRIAMDLAWEKQDLLTHLLGMEYADSFLGGRIYDPENDFPGLFYFYGILGTAAFAAFLIWVLVYALISFFRRFPSLLTAEFITAAMVLVLGLGAAQLSGQVLRKPNVTVYLSFVCASLLSQAEAAPVTGQLRPGHERNPAVSLKRIK